MLRLLLVVVILLFSFHSSKEQVCNILEKKKYIILSVFGLLFAFGVLYNSFQWDYLMNGEVTIGKITEYHFCNYNYCGSYTYVVEGKEYEGHWSGGFFKCPDGTKGCVGEEFPVRYSIEKPSISEIYLKEYNDKKNLKPRFWW